MSYAELTPLQRQILDTASLMIQPFDSLWLAKALRKPHRGVSNQIGQLCRKGLLTRMETSGKICFTDLNVAKTVRRNIDPAARHTIYSFLWRSIAVTPLQKASAETLWNIVWATLKSKQTDSGRITSDALSVAFRQVDDTLVQYIFDLYSENRMDEVSSPVQIRRAEFAFFQGRTDQARDILKKLSQTNETCERESRVLMVQINTAENSGYPVVKELNTLMAEGYDSSILAPLILQVAELYQEFGFVIEARRFIELHCTGPGILKSEYFRLCGRQNILEGHSRNALEQFQLALNEVDRDVNRYTAALIMLDLAKVHGIQGNPVKENRCLRIAEHLMRRGKRMVFNGRVMLYKNEMAMESGDVKSVLQNVTSIEDKNPDTGTFQVAVAAYSGLIVASRLNRINSCVQYCDVLFDTPGSVPWELLMRSYWVIEDMTGWNQEKVCKIKSVMKSLVQSAVHGSDVIPDATWFEIDCHKAEYFRLSQFVGDILVKEACREKPYHSGKLHEALSISERIGDQRRRSGLAELLKTEKECGIFGMPDVSVEFSQFVCELMDAGSENRYLMCLKTFFEDQFQVESGVFLVKKANGWQWNESWGEKPDRSSQRGLIRLLEQKRAFKKPAMLLSDQWVSFCFPSCSTDTGLLLLRTDTRNPVIHRLLNSQKYCMNLIRMIALTRQALINASIPPLDGMFLSSRDYADRIIGRSPQIKQLRNAVRRIADSPTTVHIVGETGTGKELIAQSIHYCGKRKHSPFLAFNCSTSSETLIESELFGHKRGAFTGAIEMRKGVFQAAQGGTVFLDEVADLPLAVQAKLLRVLQEKSVRPLGSDLDVSVNVRVISATNKHLSEEVRAGRFRSDLFYRLVVVSLKAPPLRDRPDDIALLADTFLCKAMQSLGREGIRLNSGAYGWLLKRYWHGNVRELENLIEASVNFAPHSGIIDAADLAECSTLSLDCTIDTLAEATRRFQCDHIRRVMDRCDGNISRSAALLGISRPALLKKMKMTDRLACDSE